MTGALAEVLQAVVDHVEPASWAGAEQRIAGDRDVVDDLLSRGRHAYGFTTRLGQFDDVDARGADVEFLRDHLVGWTFPVPASLTRLLSATKATQLACGGSGIGTGMYRVIRAHAVAADDGEVEGAWLDSYGAADVVPGSWWLKSVLERSGARLESGDFIASVSGTFVSTAASIVALLQTTAATSRYLALVPPTDPILWRPARSAREDRVRSLLDGPSETGPVQSAISLRDATPVVTAVVGAGDRFLEAISRRLAAPSANPLVDAAGRRILSQNSYLDFELTAAADGLLQALHLAIQHMQRLCEHAFAAAPSPRQVQIPKLAQAVVERSRTLLGAESFASHQSGGVEDLYDMSLDAAVRVVVMTRFADQAIALLEQVAPSPRRAQEIEEALWTDAAQIRPDAATRTAWSDALTFGWAGGGRPAATPVVT